MNTNNHAPDDEVRTLKRMVDRHLSESHKFICVTKSDLPGWWGKVRLFSNTTGNRNLWLDLDVTITGSLDDLVYPLTDGYDIRTAKNWAQSGHGGCQSSVMYWEGTSAEVIGEKFNSADAHWPPRTDKFWNNGQVQWGDQEWITYLRDMNHLQVEYFDSAHVVSYKYHCRNGLPPDSRVQVFHGKPDPADVNDDWVREARL